jgi:NADH-quinone oxidoreductase subunit A
VVASIVVTALAGLLGVGFVALLYGMVRILAPANPYPLKATTWECGHEPIGRARIPYHVQYYAFAILFLIFDIETAFLYPWAIVFRLLGWAGLVEMALFIAILLVGLVYAWRKGALRWA